MTTIQNIGAASPPAEIQRDDSWIIAVVTVTGPGQSVMMPPDNFQRDVVTVGVVEVYAVDPGGYGLTVVPQPSETFLDGSSSAAPGFYRRVSPTQWARLNG